MSQHDYDIVNGPGSTVRSDINNALDAVATLNAGASAPSTTFANMLWFNTSDGLLYIRNSANTAWYAHDPAREFGAALSDETTDLATGTAKFSFRMPWAGEIVGLPRATVNVAPSGSTIIVDMNKNGTTMLSTRITIDAGETSSFTAATPPVVGTTTFANNDLISFDLDQVGSGTKGQGCKVYFLAKRTS